MRSPLGRLGVAALALATGLAVAAPPARAESNGGVRVMPLGDSITDGFNVPGGYRVGLWQRMAADRHVVDLVGSGSNGPAALGDHDHEGHSGWRIADLDANVVGWLRASAPRTVLLHIGTNDVNGNVDLGNAPARLSGLLDKIRALAPNAEVFVAQITPLSDPTAEARVQAFNAAVPGVVAQKGPKTHLVDMHTGFTAADIADGVHPGASGYDKMAGRWYDALMSVPGSLTPIAVPPVDSPALLGNPQSTRCLDVSGSGTAPGTAVHLWDCHGGANQRWTRSAAGELRVAGGCLDVSANGTADGTRIQLWTCNGTAAQRFAFDPGGAVVHQASGKCVDVSAGGTANGTAIQLWTCNGTGAQRWAVR